MLIECIVVDVVIVDVFVVKFVDKVVLLLFGDLCNGFVVFGLLIDMKVVECCNVLIDDVFVYGVMLLCGGKVDIMLFLVMLFDYVMLVMCIYVEELFGLVKGIVCVDGEEVVICCVNDNVFGLVLVVFSCDVVWVLCVVVCIELGICYVNGLIVYDEV